MIRAVIIDDEAACRKVLRETIQMACSNIQLIGEADSALEGLQLVKQEQPDLIFLDVEMPDYSGFEFLSFFKSIDFEVIFSTAHESYALKAFEVSAFGYLLKPINAARLLQTIEDLERKRSLEQMEERFAALQVNMEEQGNLKRVALPISTGYRFVDLDQILYLKAEGSYTYFHLTDGESLLIAKKLKTFDYLNHHPSFYRSHRSYMVNLKHVQQYVKQDGGFILMKNDDAVSIARDRKDDFLQMMR